jgi:putative heme-binding domain-containing protein
MEVNMRIAILALLGLTCGMLLAQHEYPQVDIDQGGRLYTTNCAVCHGPDGNLIPGIDFGKGRLRRNYSDDEIVNVILKGIPGTGMPPFNLQEAQVKPLVAFVRSMSATGSSTLSVAGNAARGKSVLEGKGQCLGCHRVKDAGSRLGPDLSDVGATRRVVELENALLEPGSVILPQNRFVKVVAKNGTAVTGRILNQDTFTVQVMDDKQRLLSFPRSDLKEMTFVSTSPMPSVKGKLTDQETADVVAYLISLKGL